MFRAALLILVTLAACARPLSDSEDAFADALFGDTLDRDKVTVRAGAGVTPLPNKDWPHRDPAAAPAVTPQKPPDDLCVRVPSTQRTYRWPAAFVLWNDVFFSYRFYLHDTMEGWPEAVPVPQSLIMAHELVHVWQWQNRARTAYRPAISAQEGVDKVDPYWWVADEGREFLSYGYEQQGAMVEDFVCYALFAPDDPKFDELYRLLAPVLPVDRFLEQLGRSS